MIRQDQERRKELGDFLKSRRSRLVPADFGLPTGPRRKAKGLRREELAQLAGVGLTWYTWLEQGRDIHVSAEVLESLAQVFRLSVEERNHLFLLAHQQLPPAQAPISPKDKAHPVLQNFIDHFADCPAYVTDHRWDVIAWNQAACVVFGDFNRMNDKERNAIWRCFASPAYRALLADWEDHAQRLLAQFRSTCSRFVGEPWFKALVEELTELSPEFRTWWPRHDVFGTRIGRKEMRHPKAGTLIMEHITFQLYDDPDLKLTLYRPLPEGETDRKLAGLLQEEAAKARPGTTGPV